MTVPLGSILVPQMKNDAISVAPPSKTILDRMGALRRLRRLSASKWRWSEGRKPWRVRGQRVIEVGRVQQALLSYEIDLLM